VKKTKKTHFKIERRGKRGHKGATKYLLETERRSDATGHLSSSTILKTVGLRSVT